MVLMAKAASPPMVQMTNITGTDAALALGEADTLADVVLDVRHANYHPRVLRTRMHPSIHPRTMVQMAPMVQMAKWHRTLHVQRHCQVVLSCMAFTRRTCTA